MNMPPIDSKVRRKELDSHSWDQGSSPILGAVATRGGVLVDQVGLSGATFMGEEAVEGLRRGHAKEGRWGSMRGWGT